MPVSATAFDEPWRVACPEGHTGLRPLTEAEMAYCQRCRRSYAYEELVDRKERQTRRVGG